MCLKNISCKTHGYPYEKPLKYGGNVRSGSLCAFKVLSPGIGRFAYAHHAQLGKLRFELLIQEAGDILHSWGCRHAVIDVTVVKILIDESLDGGKVPVIQNETSIIQFLSLHDKFDNVVVAVKTATGVTVR